jgi:succinate dehydrogenase/fumarate reductase flavoprotein subunit
MMNNDRSLSRRSFLKSALALSAGTVAGVAATTFPHQAEGGLPPTQDTPVGTGYFVEGESYEDGEVVEIDLLVVGTGFAGMWATLSAAENGVKSIAMVDKGAIAKSSVSHMVMGGSIYCMPDDDQEGWLKELVSIPGYLSRQDMWMDLLSKTYDRFERYKSWGLEWKGPRLRTDGNVNVAISTGPVYKELPYGRAITAALTDQILAQNGIRFFSKTFIARLLKDTDDKKVAGAIGINRTTGNTIIFKSKATVIATGKCSFRGPHVTTEVETGDGYGLAWHVGATLNNMEFWAFDIDPAHYGMEGGTLLPVYGSRLLNGENRDFMWNYDPVNGSAADARVSSRAMAMEVKAGRGPIFMDRTTYQYLLSGQYGWDAFLAEGSWQRINEHRQTENGHDILKEPEEFYANSFGIIGAVRANLDCSTDIPGLYVSSVAISADPGKTKGCESARASWSGETAGTSASQYISSQGVPVVDIDAALKMAGELQAPLTLESGYVPNDIIWAMHEILFDYRVSLLKNADTLSAALKRLQALRKQADTSMVATDAHELVKYHETQNMLLCAELHLRGSLERTESRVCHYREDYPELDNANWLKWINFVKGEDGEARMSFEDVPIETYPLQPSPSVEVSHD